MSIKARCTHCNGTGKRQLSRVLAATMATIGRGTWSAEEIAIDMGIANTAANNRLEKLRGLGLLRRKKNYRHWDYRAAKRAREGA